MPEYRIRHLKHNGELLHTVQRPIDLHFALNNSAPHDISYAVSLDDPITRENNTLENDFIGEYQYDWELMSGLITNIHSHQSDGIIEVTGKSWMHYLDKRFYPFDPLNPYKYRLSAYQKDATEIIHDMISAVQAQPHSMQFDLSDLVSASTFIENMRIEYGDTETILSKITTMAEGKRPDCFDFSVITEKFPGDPVINKRFHVWHPDRGDPTSVVGYLYVPDDPDTEATEGHPNITDPALYDVDWTSNGPAGTHILGLGAGLAVKLGSSWGHEEAQQIFRRLDFSIDFGDVPNRAKLDRLTTGAMRAAIGPSRDAPVKIRPESVNDFWGRYKPGVYYVELADLEGAHSVRGRKKLQQIDCTVTAEGEELVELHSTLYEYWFNTDESTITREP
jgi:hypothetical protein